MGFLRGGVHNVGTTSARTGRAGRVPTTEQLILGTGLSLYLFLSLFSLSLTHAHTTIHTMHTPYPRTLIRPPHTRTKSSSTPPSPLYPSTPRASLPPTSLTFREKKGKHEQLVAPSSSSSSSSVKRRWASLVVACRASPPADAARDFIEFIARPAAILALICAQPTPPRLVHF